MSGGRMRAAKNAQSYAAAYASVVHGVLAPDLERSRLSLAGTLFCKITGEYDNMDPALRRYLAQYFRLENKKFKNTR
jgi:hypothetical protein